MKGTQQTTQIVFGSSGGDFWPRFHVCMFIFRKHQTLGPTTTVGQAGRTRVKKKFNSHIDTLNGGRPQSAQQFLPIPSVIYTHRMQGMKSPLGFPPFSLFHLVLLFQLILETKAGGATRKGCGASKAARQQNAWWWAEDVARRWKKNNANVCVPICDHHD